MAVVNTHIGFVYLANPHVASRATTKALLALRGSRIVANHHADLSIVTQEYPICVAACPIVFHTVRHPLDWLVSRYLCNGGKRGEWKAWLRKRPSRPIFDRFDGQTTAFIKYENLAEDLAQTVGHDISLDYESDHKTPGKHNYMSYWEDEDIRWARQRFASDFETYHYE